MSRMKGQSFLVATSGKRMPPTLKRSRILEIKARNRWGKCGRRRWKNSPDAAEKRGGHPKGCVHTHGDRGKVS